MVKVGVGSGAPEPFPERLRTSSEFPLYSLIPFAIRTEGSQVPSVGNTGSLKLPFPVVVSYPQSSSLFPDGTTANVQIESFQSLSYLTDGRTVLNLFETVVFLHRLTWTVYRTTQSLGLRTPSLTPCSPPLNYVHLNTLWCNSCFPLVNIKDQCPPICQ